jgi:ribosomal protein L37E
MAFFGYCARCERSTPRFTVGVCSICGYERGTPERIVRMKLDWQQALFDLMANEKVRLEVTGEMGEVDASLAVWRDRRWADGIHVINAETFDEAMGDLMTQWRAAEAKP